MIFNDLALMRSHVKKMNYVFKTALVLLTLAELLLMIRGLLFFNLEKLKLRMYLYSYIFLFLTSFSALIAFFVYGSKERHLKHTVIGIYIYAFCLIMWSTAVTAIDCYANGDSGIMVYIMTTIAVGVLTLIKPWIFLIYTGISSALLLFLTVITRNWQPYSSGFYINFFIFCLTAIFINTHNYSLSKREHEAAQRLTKLSYTDQLTDVYNRRQLDKHMAERTEQKEPFVFVLLDIDDFKKVNDSYGHHEGDRCLIILAKMLTEHFGNCVYRFGGDEFAILPQTDITETCAKLDIINQTLGSLIGNLQLHISAGVYTVSASDTPTDVFCKTDRALYLAKSRSKAQWAIYEKN